MRVRVRVRVRVRAVMVRVGASFGLPSYSVLASSSK